MPNQITNKNTTKAPFAPKVPKKLNQHGDERIDNYFWLNQREDTKVLDYLREENEFYRVNTQHLEDFRKELFIEMKARIKEDDQTVPYRFNGYWYQTRYETELEYPVYLRRKDKKTASEEVIFDGNEMARGHEYFHLKGISVSPDNKMATFGIDTVSRRQYTMQVKNLQNGQIYPDKLENTTGTAVWADDNETIFYTAKDPLTLRANKIYRHKLGTPSSEDLLVFEETDETYITFIYKSKSRKYIIIGSCSTLTSEYRILRSDEPEGEFEIFSPRIRGLEYSIFHYGQRFYILTNKDGATNFKLMCADEEHTMTDRWEEFIGHQDDVLLEDVEIFEEFYVLSERIKGLNKLRIVRWDGSDSYYIPFDSETYVAGTYVNPDFASHTLRYVYNAMTTPYSIIDFNMETKKKQVLKVQEVLGGKFDENNYTSKRLWAEATDGMQIPISLVYKTDTAIDGTSPLLLYGYGAYGSTVDPHFSSVRLSLLDRGFIYAIAHVRGGEYLGRSWYENGRLMFKKNTFTDFIDCSKYLISQKYTSPDHLYAYGASAGGLLIGAVVNMAPELYNGVIAAVPFVDVITTMLDHTIPLTTGEYDEWGNPNEEEYYDYIKSYSPYDNVRAQEYPNMLVTTGLHDSQVQYWEPAKWVAKLREFKTDISQLYLDTNMGTGHGGASGRFEALKETAKEYAFILDLEGKITQSEKK
ncbi:MAG: S9 family peptidase [Flavobacteriaceae bacterium]